jgi:hypothetical protein
MVLDDLLTVLGYDNFVIGGGYSGAGWDWLDFPVWSNNQAARE